MKTSIPIMYFAMMVVVSSQFSVVRANAAEPIQCNMDLANHYGPFDYYDAKNHTDNTISIVTGRHLTNNMLQLIGGSTGTISADLDYTLRATPNHPQALDLASRLSIAVVRGQKPPKEKLNRKVDCYFMRAVSLNPKIGETFYIWGIHLQRVSEYAESYKKYKRAEELGMSSPPFQYNFGLLQFSLENYHLARERANKAASMGYPMKALKNKLEARGY